MKDLVVAAIGYGIGATSVAYAIVWFSKRKQLLSPVKAFIPIVGFLVACLVTISRLPFMSWEYLRICILSQLKEGVRQQTYIC